MRVCSILQRFSGGSGGAEPPQPLSRECTTREGGLQALERQRKCDRAGEGEIESAREREREAERERARASETGTAGRTPITVRWVYGYLLIRSLINYVNLRRNYVNTYGTPTRMHPQFYHAFREGLEGAVAEPPSCVARDGRGASGGGGQGSWTKN